MRIAVRCPSPRSDALLDEVTAGVERLHLRSSTPMGQPILATFPAPVKRATAVGGSNCGSNRGYDA
jgi:hypothetical protein